MGAITFDTLAYSKKLQKAGMNVEQADAFANAQKDALKEMVDIQELVTKKDLAIVKRDLEISIKDLDAKIIKSKYEIIKWVIGLLITQTGIIVAAISLLKP